MKMQYYDSRLFGRMLRAMIYLDYPAPDAGYA